MQFRFHGCAKLGEPTGCEGKIEPLPSLPVELHSLGAHHIPAQRKLLLRHLSTLLQRR